MGDAAHRDPEKVVARLWSRALAGEIRITMKCSIQGCPGQYESERIVHTVRKGSDIYIFEHVPADVCGDTLLSPSTIRRLEDLLCTKAKPGKMAPIYEYI